MRVNINPDQYPTKQDYTLAQEQFVARLESLGNLNPSLLLYGSVSPTRRNLVLGVSDIDLLLVLYCDLITDKNFLWSIGRLLKEVVEERNVRIDLSVYDISIVRDGRFFPFGRQFREQFNQGSLLLGRDFRPEIKWFNNPYAAEAAIGYNLRALRKKFIELPYNQANDYRQFINDFRTFLKKVKNFRFSCLDCIGFKISNPILEEIVKISMDAEEIKKLERDPRSMVGCFRKGLNSYEGAAKEIMDTCTSKSF